MMLMMETLTPNRDTRSEMRTGKLAKAATWQQHDKEVLQNELSDSVEIWQRGKDTINFVTKVGKCIHKRRKNWTGIFLSTKQPLLFLSQRSLPTNGS